MIKVDIIPQEEMTTPSDTALAEKIYKVIEDQGKALEKMGTCLTKLEESKFKNPVVVDVNEEEDKEEWDEKDETDYERNKQFEKLTTGNLAMKEKMGKMQLTFHKAQGIDGCLYNMGDLGSKTPIPLLLKFNISDAEKFDGTGDTKQHVRRYIIIIEMKGLDEKQNLHAFPLSLTGDALRWYYSLYPSKTKVWNELVELSVDQFIFNTMIDVALRDLYTTK